MTAQGWPRKRTGPRHPTSVYWSDWLAQADILWKYQPDVFQLAALKAARGSPQMPRDLFISAIRGRLFMLTLEDGRKMYPMCAVRDVSESLDVLAQTDGDVLVRVNGLWQSLGPGLDGQVVTWSAALGRPVWGTGGGGGDLYTPPTVSTFGTIFGDPTPTLVQSAYGPLVMNRPAAAAAPRVAGAVQTLASPPYTYRVGIRGSQELLTSSQFGLVLRDSATGRLVTFCFRMLTATSAPRLSISNWNSHTSYQAEAAFKVFYQVGALFLRIKDTGVNFEFSFSSDDANYSLIATLGRTAWLAAPNQVGIVLCSASIESVASTLSVFHYQAT